MWQLPVTSFETPAPLLLEDDLLPPMVTGITPLKINDRNYKKCRVEEYVFLFQTAEHGGLVQMILPFQTGEF